MYFRAQGTLELYKHKHEPLSIIAKSMSEMDKKAASKKQRKMLATKLFGARRPRKHDETDQYGLRRQTLTNTPITLGDLPGGYDSESFDGRPISPFEEDIYKEKMYSPSRCTDVTNEVTDARRRYPAKRTFSGSSCPAMRAELDAISMHVLEKSFALHARHEEKETNTPVGIKDDIECKNSNDGGAQTSMPKTCNVMVAQDVNTVGGHNMVMDPNRFVKPTVAEQGNDLSECESDASSPNDGDAGVDIPSLPVRTHAK